MQTRFGRGANEVKKRIPTVASEYLAENTEEDVNTLTLTASLSALGNSGNLPRGIQYDNFYNDLII